MRSEKIGIIGSGLIGRAWSMLFSSVGYQVTLYDIESEQIDRALSELRSQLFELEEKGLLRGSTLNAQKQWECISATKDIKELVRDAVFIQECIPERIDLKRTLYCQLDEIVEDQTIISSSTSTFMPSLFSAELKHKANMLVCHPLNPPYYIPLVEIVPAPWTSPEIVERARLLMLEIGQKPVTLSREIEGFATNRIQYAILNEVWHLVEDGVLTVADVDSVMTNGLGLRYALLGPWETAHVNADGVANYCSRFGNEIYTVSRTFAGIPKMENGSATLAKIASECEKIVPIAELPQRRQQRDKFLIELGKLKKDF